MALEGQAQASRSRLEAIVAKQRPEDDPSLVEARLVYENDNLELENYDKKHDPTGALKRERLGAGIRESLTPLLERPQEQLKNPFLEQYVTPVFAVNMGELDRLNKAGHKLGDEALGHAAMNIENDVVDHLVRQGLTAEEAVEMFSVYRMDSNSFAVKFTRNIPKPQADAIRELLSKPAGQSGIDVGGLESPPLVADYVALEEIPPLLEGVAEDGKNLETKAVQMTFDLLISANEMRKTVERFKRMRDVMVGDRADEKKAKELFVFLQKSLKDVVSHSEMAQVQSYDELKEFFERAGDDADQLAWEGAFAKVSDGLRRRYEKDRAYAQHVQSIVRGRVEKERGLPLDEREITGNIAIAYPEAASVEGEPEFVAPDKDAATQGLRDLRAAEAALADVMSKPATTEVERQRQRNARLKVENLREDRDTATGFENRGKLFERLEKALAENRPATSVSMDMGFLKYFDQVGGAKTGDLAILKTAEVFDAVRAEYASKGLEVGLYRLGGDEFGMSLVAAEGMDAAAFRELVSKLPADLARAVESAGKIPPQEGAKPGYYASKLNVGIGLHTFESAQAAAGETEEAGALGEPPPDLPEDQLDAWKRNKQAEHLIVVSDKLMEFHKSTNRFIELINTFDAAEREADPAKKKVADAHFRQLVSFSEKAIFGTGESKIREWHEAVAGLEGAERLSRLTDLISDFVIERTERELEESQDKKALSEQQLERAVYQKYLEGRVSELRTRVSQLEAQYGAEHARYQEAMQRLAEAEARADEIAGIRSRLSQAA